MTNSGIPEYIIGNFRKFPNSGIETFGIPDKHYVGTVQPINFKSKKFQVSFWVLMSQAQIFIIVAGTNIYYPNLLRIYVGMYSCADFFHEI